MKKGKRGNGYVGVRLSQFCQFLENSNYPTTATFTMANYYYFK